MTAAPVRLSADDIDLLSDEEKVALLAEQQERLTEIIESARQAETNVAAGEFEVAAIELRSLLDSGIDHQHAVAILHRVANLLDAEAIIVRRFPRIAHLIFGAAVTVHDLPVVMEAGYSETEDGAVVPVIRAGGVAHLWAIADAIVGLEDAATDADVEASDG